MTMIATNSSQAPIASTYEAPRFEPHTNLTLKWYNESSPRNVLVNHFSVSSFGPLSQPSLPYLYNDSQVARARSARYRPLLSAKARH